MISIVDKNHNNGSFTVYHSIHYVCFYGLSLQMRFTQGVGDNGQENAGSLLTCRLMTIIAKGLEEYENASGVFFRFLSPHPFYPSDPCSEISGFSA